MSIRTKYQCFISSTYEDLKKEREVCAKAILRANHIPAGMEYFHPTSEMKKYIKNWIIDSDIVYYKPPGRIMQDKKAHSLTGRRCLLAAPHFFCYNTIILIIP